jgi:hypothetical protein
MQDQREAARHRSGVRMSTYEHRPVNPNRSGITRSGNVTGFTATYRHPSDPAVPAWAWAAVLALLVGVWVLL